jgi:hypothetical protein
VAWCKKPGNRPADIPAGPVAAYADEWKGWADWLGTRNFKNVDWRPFTAARQFAHKLGLKSNPEWFAWCRTPDKPTDIPSNPDRAYADEWKGWGDWLGTGNFTNIDWRPFTEARQFAHKLGLRSNLEWRAWCKTRDRPADIPTKPDSVYGEWKSWGDWLGTENFTNVEWRAFTEAREFARSLGLKSRSEWFAWCKTQDRPTDIPRNPYGTYAYEWKSWGDWLGTGHFTNVEWRAFTEAREFARSLGLKSSYEWFAWCKTPDKPADIPRVPYGTYADEWKSWGDWLGTENLRNVEWRPFTEAREFARSLGFKCGRDWAAWCKKPGNRPADIPAGPVAAYADEWTNWGDWLGTGNFKNVDWRPFTEARDFARSLGCKSEREWRAWRKKPGNRPPDIPAGPDAAYADEWKGWADWLGTWRQRGSLPFAEAREYARPLRTKSRREWQAQS